LKLLPNLEPGQHHSFVSFAGNSTPAQQRSFPQELVLDEGRRNFLPRTITTVPVWQSAWAPAEAMYAAQPVTMHHSALQVVS